MKIKSVVILLLVIIGVSCSRKKYISNSELEIKDPGNYYNFYIVDTIRIDDPIRIHSEKFGGQFVVSRPVLKEYNGKRDFFLRPDVFLLSGDLYWDLPPGLYDKYKYPDYGGCNLVKSESIQVGLEVYEYKSSSMEFILGLINGDFYNKRHNSYNYFGLQKHDNKNAYYRVVYPLCR